ncbi:MAG TPA: D-glycero-beta-D-manno-heptose-1,7-bisphosphate 7-phosphatase [Gammaproteobacteria bacterium]|jgi:D-glycero-D-manno-heptose 1,7-bisphosphate phosphatase|nr:D-glycero-beta-D-manno-heptose 1,7-bisphosphate 7-phosphatase [Gammaproteobacteria bacterium]MDP6732585.1 D-glycero-beta-D-manno-heptose 1,7-bisphosphate 7-phosphatase [Gammaproteobacteria bacterium]HAJ74911.1 D-glycero-beta-D-manno-heptose-1,7-bisphosphate 7-phosphatase [Gammaproteobacteria bacterium]|tara:strand:+ start:889 stop:1440 length:552 start_codon:yes stop_codon:yes gene_type:complete
MKTVILDRDGVINEDSDEYIKSAEEFIPISSSLDAIASLHRAGFRIAVASNQSGLGRSLFDEFALANIHHKLCSMAEAAGGFVDGIFYCPHRPEDGCSCRKPGTGLLEQIEREYSCSLSNCYFVGDSLKDIQAAKAYGLRPVLVRTGKGAQTEQELLRGKQSAVPVFDDLAAAVERLILHSND